jgi:hypothetical protein
LLVDGQERRAQERGQVGTYLVLPVRGSGTESFRHRVSMRRPSFVRQKFFHCCPGITNPATGHHRTRTRTRTTAHAPPHTHHRTRTRTRTSGLQCVFGGGRGVSVRSWSSSECRASKTRRTSGVWSGGMRRSKRSAPSASSAQ